VRRSAEDQRKKKAHICSTDEPVILEERKQEPGKLFNVETDMGDFRLALRSFLKAPVFTIVAVLSLALGIGANTAMFTLVDQVLLRLLPVKDPKELVQLRVEGGRFGSNSGDGVHTFSHPTYLALRDQNTVFSGLTGQRLESASLVGEDRSEMISVGLVAGNFFDVLGVQSASGRMLNPADDTVRMGHPVAVLQYDFWKNRFGGKADTVGSTVRLNGSPFTVVGIAAQGFEGTETGLPTNLWVPVMMKPAITPTWDELDNERYSWFYLFGRLKPGITREQAEASMKVLYRQRQDVELKGEQFRKFPMFKERFLKQNFRLIPASRGQSGIRDRFERPLTVLQGLVGLVLLIACANVASLLLARAAARQREIAIRTALGASRGQVIRQLLMESLMLAAAGGVAGLVLSNWLASGLIRFLPFDPDRLSLASTPDLRILLFTTCITLMTALLFGLAPAWQGSRVSPAVTLKQEAGSVVGGHGNVRLRKTLVALQVGLSALLLIGAGLFSRSLRNLQNVDLGFKTENVVMFGVRPATVYEANRKLQLYRSLVEGLATVPGVKAVGANTSRLLTGGRWDSSITIPGVGVKDNNFPWSFFNAVTPGYFDALGIPVKMGRDFTWRDWGSSKRVCLVNEALVKEYLPGENPVGRMMAQGASQPPNMEIIGVFANAKYEDVRGTIPRQTFMSMDANIQFVSGVTVYARAGGDVRQVMAQLREQVRKVDSNLVISDMRTMDEQLNMRLTNERMLSFLSAGFAVLATLLAVVGLYGVLAFIVTRRTREIGIRMALGARQGSVVRMVLGETMLVIFGGVIAGVVASFLGGRYVETQLFGLKAADPPVFAISVAVLVSASLVAAFIPAWRASRIDPLHALRYE
jgi:predicted permease